MTEQQWLLMLRFMFWVMHVLLRSTVQGSVMLKESPGRFEYELEKEIERLTPPK